MKADTEIRAMLPQTMNVWSSQKLEDATLWGLDGVQRRALSTP